MNGLLFGSAVGLVALLLSQAAAFSSPIKSYCAKSEGGVLRVLGDAMVVGVTDTHVVVVSKSAGDALFVPLLMASKDFQLRSRAGKDLSRAMETLVASGRRLDDGWNGKNVIYVEKFSSKSISSRTHSAESRLSNAHVSSSNTEAVARRSPLDAIPNASNLQESQTQLNRFVYDSQKNAMRMNQDAMRQHNRMVEDMQNGIDPTGMRNLQRSAEDSATRMNRQATDANLDGMRGMNDAMRHSGAGAPPAIEPVMPMQAPMLP